MLLRFTVLMSFILLPWQVMAITLVENEKAHAVLVTSDEPAQVAQYAAEEFQRHVYQATGVVLPILTESQVSDEPLSHIYIGNTRAASEQHIVPECLGPDGFVLRVVGDDLYVLSNEEDGDDPWRRSVGSRRGTLFGVYELLERYVGVRWLWPGELGTYVPKTQALKIDDALNETQEPALQFRRFRGHFIRQHAASYDPDIRRLAFSDEGIQNYAKDLQIYKARYRLGDTKPKPPVGHEFSGWWERYGESHPEWFMLGSDGRRGPPAGRGSYHVPMCVSNEDLHRYIVEEAWDGGDILRLGEVDLRVFCQCENCLAWDEPHPDTHPNFVNNLYRPRMVSNRYARFWKTIQEMAARRNPAVVVTTFLYWNYIPAPTLNIEFNGKVYGEFVPWGQDEVTYFPMQESAYRWLQEQWLGWKQSGVIMAYRPNYFHGGYVMPHLSTSQAANFFKFAYENGMIGFDQDMLIGHWAVKGPMLYIHMRLAVDPMLNVDQLRDEYFAAFGAASEHVRDYFDYWEQYALNRPGGNLHNHVDAHIAYPQEVFHEGAAYLDRAMRAVESDCDEQYAQRVAFLQAGLEHARLASYFTSTLDLGRVPDNAEQFRKAQEALYALATFRRDHEHLYIADYVHASRQENRRIDIDTLMKSIDEIEFQGEGALESLHEWEFRQDESDEGVAAGWYKPEQQNAHEWQPIVVPAFWRDTHVGSYLGYGWYRVVFEVPKKHRNEPLNVLFHSVDEQAWVYLNGQLVGEHTVASQGLPVSVLWNRPFTIQLPAEYLNPDGDNLLVVRVHASEGNAGIWGSVRIFAPQDLD